MQDNYNRGGFIAFIFSVVFSLAFMFYIALFHGGVDLKELPEATAKGMKDQPGEAKGEAADVDVSKVEKPWVSSPEMIAHGHRVLLNNCAMCHGQEGKGDGPAGLNLNPRPRNFVKGDWKQGGRSQDLFHTLQIGVKGSSMVSFKQLPVNDRWAVVHYIRSITTNKIPDDPKQLEAFAKTAD